MWPSLIQTIDFDKKPTRIEDDYANYRIWTVNDTYFDCFNKLSLSKES